MISNYFKVMGDGLGKAADCFPFEGSDISRERAFMLASKHASNHQSKRPRIVAYHRTYETPHLVGIPSGVAS